MILTLRFLKIHCFYHIISFHIIFTEAATGVFKPAPPFRSIASVPSNAIVFGCLVGIQRFGCKSMELVRFKEDFWNDIFGCACIYPYYKAFIGNTERRLMLHNRAVGGAVALALVYANLIA